MSETWQSVIAISVTAAIMLVVLLSFFTSDARSVRQRKIDRIETNINSIFDRLYAIEGIVHADVKACPTASPESSYRNGVLHDLRLTEFELVCLRLSVQVSGQLLLPTVMVDHLGKQIEQLLEKVNGDAK